MFLIMSLFSGCVSLLLPKLPINCPENAIQVRQAIWAASKKYSLNVVTGLSIMATK